MLANMFANVPVIYGQHTNPLTTNIQLLHIQHIGQKTVQRVPPTYDQQFGQPDEQYVSWDWNLLPPPPPKKKKIYHGTCALAWIKGT